MTRTPTFTAWLNGAHNGLRANPTVTGGRMHGALVALWRSRDHLAGGVYFGPASYRITRPVWVRGVWIPRRQP